MTTLYVMPTPSPYGVRLQMAIDIAAGDHLPGIERGDLSKATGISPQAIGQCLNGQTKALTAENTAKAARFLKVDPYWLATGEGEPRPADWLARQSLTPEAVVVAARFDELGVAEKRQFRRYLRALIDPDPEAGEQGDEGGFFRLLDKPVHSIKNR